jgi:hypothetical protein
VNKKRNMILRRLRQPPLLHATLLVALLLTQPPNLCLAKQRLFNIFWNTTNPMFRIDNTDNVFDINQGNPAWEYDQANIICPVYPVGTREADMERYIIYRVSKEEFDNCRLTDPNPRVIAVCNKPHRLMYFTLTFRSFTPTPGALEFRPGEDYYFISTSSQTDLQRRIGGRCSTNNMKLVFKIAPLEARTTKASVNNPRPSDDGPTRMPALTKQHYEYLYPSGDGGGYGELSSNSVEHEKRSEDYESHDVFRQQASVMHDAADNSSSVMRPSSWTAVAFLIVCVLRTLVLS